MNSDQQNATAALKIIADREMRYQLFPSEIFDEYAWNMLLHLFVAYDRGEKLSEAKLIGLVRASTREGQRWLFQLAKDKQIEVRSAGDYVVLTTEAVERLRSYLNVANIA